MAESLASQSLPPERVLISVDGVEAPMSPEEIGSAALIRGPKAGPGETRNRAIDEIPDGLILFLNDDVAPAEDLIERHVEAAELIHRTGGRAMLVGAAPWAPRSGDPRRALVIDRVVAETAMIFFYNRMIGRPRDHDWGPRHAWTLNLSVRREHCDLFDSRLAYPMFDDLEWASRVSSRHGCDVRYVPEALVTHSHLYTAHDLLRREILLGHQLHTLVVIDRALGESIGSGWFAADRTDYLPSLIETGADAFRAFCEIAEQPAANLPTEEIEAIGDSCRPWRIAARSLGFINARNGLCFEDTAREGVNQLSAAVAVSRKGPQS